eukprot:comp18868_c0_seq1/m.20940 comp18868_c0_seq1/g.20940  ORF comp18868_c0_seq1/g.20940 comp18868_c0_seq1/m.20940 type:complete len:626 (-) comp18868_c0_seq1:566-2443(-)
MPTIADAKKQRTLAREAQTLQSSELELPHTEELLLQAPQVKPYSPKPGAEDTISTSSAPLELQARDSHNELGTPGGLSQPDSEDLVPPLLAGPVSSSSLSPSPGLTDRKRFSTSMGSLIKSSLSDLKDSISDDVDKLKRSTSLYKKRRDGEDRLRSQSVSNTSNGSAASPKVPTPAEGRSSLKKSDINTELTGSKRFSSIFGELCPGEIGLNDYVAAMTRHRVVMQGRLFVSDKSVCFTAMISKKLYVLPFNEIRFILKKKWAKLPTAIRVVMKGEQGKAYTFHSMVSRNECYDELINLWMANNEGQPASSVMGEGEEEDESAETDGDNASSPASRRDSGTEEDGPPVDCACTDHCEKEFANEIVDVSAGRLFAMIFGNDSEFSKDFCENVRGYTGLTCSKWEPEEGTDREKRELTFTMPLKKNPIGPKVADVVEKQWLVKRVEGKVYVILSESMTPKLPYGDSLVTRNRMCITHHGPKQARLRITSEIYFKKSVMGPVKYAIQKSSYSMIEENHQALVQAIKRYLAGGLIAAPGGTPAESNALKAGVTQPIAPSVGGGVPVAVAGEGWVLPPVVGVAIGVLVLVVVVCLIILVVYLGRLQESLDRLVEIQQALLQSAAQCNVKM